MKPKIDLRSKFVMSLAATALLLVVGGVAAPSTISPGALLGMLPFFAVLAVAALGQHIVIQQRGLDLSAAGIISLTGVLVSSYPASDAGGLETIAFVGLALVAGFAAGALNGVVIAVLKVPAIIATLGTNALFQGAAIALSGGAAQQVPAHLTAFVRGSLLAVPVTLIILAVLIAAAIFLLDRSNVGRRLVACAVSPRGAAALGIHITRYQVATYGLAGLSYALAGVLLSGTLVSPPVFSGTPYMLATIAAVVVGGNSIAGGDRASIAATTLGAFFLVYLGQLLVSLGYGTSTQNIVQALIVLCSAIVPKVLMSGRFGWTKT